ncbi:MAG: peptidase [Candidatus Marinimicrobia bacterium]|nr:peptidase [Candidatus Neomarinimicrobiota bacterium]MAQ44081.1 peptidase [Candidatus Neomarinimicrobiota bacterium]|tara:strand:- start:7654 stop:10845 length:3192 start_codon:yes stop_codon:yes gene_type:complete
MSGYYRFPTINNSKIVFVADDDLWVVKLDDSKAYRLTTNLSEVSSPLFSPDGKWIAYIGTEDGNSEVYIMSEKGGPSTRLTYDGAFASKICAWHNDDIIFATDLSQPFGRVSNLAKINKKGGPTTVLDYGISSNISFGNPGVILGRNTADPARWKRYKGGTAGELWISNDNKMNFKKLITLKGNMACPMWINQRIYFLADHDGISNIYSCLKSGRSLKQHTYHKNYYARNATTDGNNIVYHCGADIYCFDIDNNHTSKVDIDFNSSMIQRSRKFINPESYLEDISINNDGSMVSFSSRGKAFCMGNWNGPVYEQGKSDGVRYQKPRFLNDNKKIVMVSDDSGNERLEIHFIKGKKKSKVLDLDIGRPYDMKISPIKDQIAISNHRNELLLIDLKKNTMYKIDRSKFSVIGSSFNWSPDGRYIAYSCSLNSRVNGIKIHDLESKKSHKVSDPILNDFNPVFDPSGKYLAFLSNRVFNPVYDNMHFDLGFPRGEKPYIITLNKETPSPLYKTSPKPIKDTKKKDDKKKDEDSKIKIDFNGIEKRIMAIPTEEGLFENIGFINNKLFYNVYPDEGSFGDIPWYDFSSSDTSTILFYDLDTNKEKMFMSNVSSFTTIPSIERILIKSKNGIRLIDGNTIPSKDVISKSEYNISSGKINFNRARVSIDPISEWKQMYSEAWRLQRDFFWVKNMSGINWKKIHERYFKLINRIHTRTEFSDLVWEMQGELGTSHCYEFGGDYKPRRHYQVGLLGADLEYDEKGKAYKIINLIKGDVWSGYITSPLLRPGLNIEEGMLIKTIQGNKLKKTESPNKLLVNQVNKDIEIKISDSNGKNERDIVIKTIPSVSHMRYRDWVEKNREYVHKKTKNKVGYVHIPDMSPWGYSEFHRYWLSEIQYDALIVDVRFNGGGHVSQLLLEKLARKRIGYDTTRWMGTESYPGDSVAGPIIAITNEYAGSDGDIFSHSFKLMKLGKLIGKRTWGGVIGIWPRNLLVDGTITTQPEFSFWFKDVGWEVENYGTNVDIEVDITPKDYAKGIDTQLDRGIKEILNDLKKNPVIMPKLDNKPKLGK